MAFKIQSVFGSEFIIDEQNAVKRAIGDWQGFLAPNDFAAIPSGTEAGISARSINPALTIKTFKFTSLTRTNNQHSLHID
jgi:hypothetical protein